MSVVLRVLLIVCSAIYMINIIKRVRKSKLQIEHTIYWIGLSCGLIILAVFPDIATGLAALIGIQSPVNLIFLFVIFLMLLKIFNMTIEISQLEYKIKELVQKMALDDYDRNKDME